MSGYYIWRSQQIVFCSESAAASSWKSHNDMDAIVADLSVSAACNVTSKRPDAALNLQAKDSGHHNPPSLAEETEVVKFIDDILIEVNADDTSGQAVFIKQFSRGNFAGLDIIGYLPQITNVPLPIKLLSLNAFWSEWKQIGEIEKIQRLQLEKSIARHSNKAASIDVEFTLEAACKSHMKKESNSKLKMGTKLIVNFHI